MTGSRVLDHPGSSDALTSHSCQYQLTGHLDAIAKDLNSHHLIEFTIKRGMIWEFSIPPLGKTKLRKKFCAQSDIIQGSMV